MVVDTYVWVVNPVSNLVDKICNLENWLVNYRSCAETRFHSNPSYKLLRVIVDVDIFFLLRQKPVLSFKDPFLLRMTQVRDPRRELRVEIEAVI